MDMGLSFQAASRADRVCLGGKAWSLSSPHPEHKRAGGFILPRVSTNTPLTFFPSEASFGHLMRGSAPKFRERTRTGARHPSRVKRVR